MIGYPLLVNIVYPNICLIGTFFPNKHIGDSAFRPLERRVEDESFPNLVAVHNAIAIANLFDK
jgi:hypothetical protein